MGLRMNSTITWTKLELRGLLEDEDCHVHFEKTEKHLALHPFHLTDLNAALREILGASVNNYDSKLGGIILSYKKPKIVSPLGTILYDACHVHIDVVADFYIFKPKVGDSLKGIVNKKSLDHVGILVHKAFNVSIPRPNEKNWPGHLVRIGQEVRFTITYLDFKGRLPYIRASMNADDYLQGCSLSIEKFESTDDNASVSKSVKFLYDDDGDLVNSNAISPVKPKKLKKEKNRDEIGTKRKKNKVKTEIVSLEAESDTTKGKRSKKLKKRVMSDSNDEDVVANIPLKKPKKSKKQRSDHELKVKSESEVDDNTVFSQIDPELTRAKTWKNIWKSVISDSDDESMTTEIKPQITKKIKKEKCDVKAELKTETYKVSSNIESSETGNDTIKMKWKKKSKTTLTDEESDHEIRFKTLQKTNRSIIDDSDDEVATKYEEIKIKEEVSSEAESNASSVE